MLQTSTLSSELSQKLLRMIYFRPSQITLLAYIYTIFYHVKQYKLTRWRANRQNDIFNYMQLAQDAGLSSQNMLVMTSVSLV